LTIPAARKPHPLPNRLSPSALARYRVCPKQFLLCDIERVTRREERSPTLVVANAVHEALQLFYGLDLAYRSADNATRCLRAVWKKHRGSVFQTKESEAAAGVEAILMLRRYCESFDITSTPVALERWVGVQLGTTRLYGKIDRADRFSDGLDLIDYKTGRRALEAGDLKHEPAVQVYVVGAEATFRAEVRRVRLIYLALGFEVCWEPEREDVEALRERLAATLGEIAIDEQFVARPGQQCGFCPAQLDCPDKDRVLIEQVAKAADEAAAEVPF
jgi:putative RecB family exonuclease